MLNDLKGGMMYWHGRDRSCRPILAQALPLGVALKWFSTLSNGRFGGWKRSPNLMQTVQLGALMGFFLHGILARMPYWTFGRMMLFILEFAVRYLLVPGRVENWVLIVEPPARFEECPGLESYASPVCSAVTVTGPGRLWPVHGSRLCLPDHLQAHHIHATSQVALNL